MTDRPILFSAPMVLALLEGRKTQTRRMLKPQPYVVQEQDGVRWWNLAGRPGGTIVMGDSALLRAHRKPAVGDRLWVRETWAPSEFVTGDGSRFFYRADADEDGTVPYLVSGTPSGGGVGNARIDRWRVSIHMPRPASRITLTVTDVRAQRLQEITEEDARAEGARAAYGEPFATDSGLTDRRRFQLLWDTLHGPGAWDANPHVVALTFTVAQRNIDA